VSQRTRGGLIRYRPVTPGCRVAVVAPASPFDRDQFEAGLVELRRLGLDPVYDDDVFERLPIVAGSARLRADALLRAWSRPDVDAVMAVRGGYGSQELLPLLDAARARKARTAFIGYSDVTSLHIWLAAEAGITSVYGPMLEGRLAVGPAAYDENTFWRGLSVQAPGELVADGVEVLRPGEASGPLFGGTIANITASFGTPFQFRPPNGSVLFFEDIGERPYRIHRMFTQIRQAGLLERASAIVIGQMPSCEEPGGVVTVRDVVAELLADFPGPVVYGFPAGHTTTPLMTLPLGVWTRVVTAGVPRLIVEEAGAAP